MNDDDFMVLALRVICRTAKPVELAQLINIVSQDRRRYMQFSATIWMLRVLRVAAKSAKLPPPPDEPMPERVKARLLAALASRN
jgi:hypothetical protein